MYQCSTTSVKFSCNFIERTSQINVMANTFRQLRLFCLERLPIHLQLSEQRMFFDGSQNKI